MQKKYVLKKYPEDFIVEEIPENFQLKETGKYSIFLMKKKEYNTINALKVIASHLNCKIREIGFAGNKDRNAITKQYISLPSYFKQKIMDFKNENINLLFQGFSDSPIALGKLKGNKFIITLRDCKIKPKKKIKFVNYYGEQRFSKNNVDIGRCLLKKDFEKARNLIFESGLQNKELSVYIDKNPNDFIGAIQSLPEKTISLFINAFQSFIWNKIVSEIIKEESSGIIEISNEKLNISYSEKNYNELPLIGFETEIEKSKYSTLIEKILMQENIGQRDFIIPQLPRISASGGYRNVFENVEDLFIDEKQENVYEISFILSKGSYATVFIENLFL